MTRILVVDNYDSFVWNLVHYLAQLGAEVEVWRNDDPRFAGAVDEGAAHPGPGDEGAPHPGPGDEGAPHPGPGDEGALHPGIGDTPAVDAAVLADFDGILLSPGPGTPEHAGVCVELVRRVGGTVPVFGVCLGLQSIAVAYGGTVGRAAELLHGKVSQVRHAGAGTLSGLPNPFRATRYHSLAITRLPDALEVTAETDTGVIMAVRHRELPVEAVQFHPESVLTEGGYQLLANWLAVCGDRDAPGRAVGLAPLMSLP